MKKIATLLIAAVCLLGCQKRDADLHDPAIRQQLTTMLGDLYTDHAVPKAISDINAILTVNSQKLSVQQSEKLGQARDKMLGMRKILDDAKSGAKYSDEEYRTLFSDAKKLIGEAAATF
jgi:hypothetical protein